MVEIKNYYVELNDTFTTEDGRKVICCDDISTHHKQCEHCVFSKKDYGSYTCNGIGHRMLCSPSVRDDCLHVHFKLVGETKI